MSTGTIVRIYAQGADAILRLITKLEDRIEDLEAQLTRSPQPVIASLMKELGQAKSTLAREMWWNYAHFLARKQKSSIKQMIIREKKAGRLGSVQRGERSRNTFSLLVGKKRWILNIFPPQRVSIRTVTGKHKWEVDLEPFQPMNWQSGRSYATRLEALERACGVCERCKERAVTQVHHKVRLRGRSFLARLNSDRDQRYGAIALCNECHLAVHGGNYSPERKRSAQSAVIR